MTLEILYALLLSLSPLSDHHGHPIARPVSVLQSIARVTLEIADKHPEVDPLLLAAEFDVIGAHESGYSTHPRGSNDHGVSKGYGQTPRASTPDDLLGQLREVGRWILVSTKSCAAKPLHMYAAGPAGCGAVLPVADQYEREAEERRALMAKRKLLTQE